ncbi:PTS transporter subunit EIIC [Clostridium oceanicum]|uniref:Glucose-specific PTS transporter subunit IIBC n=1 Tax=Clostridium oceanicum TaxID=1543 RepID=A0ABN1JEY7_9CLOT
MSGNKKYFAFFQKLGKVLMTPVMILPIAGILLGIGAAFTSASILNVCPALENPFVQLIFKLFKVVGGIVFSNLPVIFAISIAIGYVKREKGIAALAAFISFIVMHKTMSTILISLGKLNPEKLTTGQSLILGIPSLDVGIFGGIIIGFVVAYLHNKYYDIMLPPALSIFSGTKFVPVISILGSIVVGIILSFLWPFVQTGLSSLSLLIKSTGAIGTFIYGSVERLLLPFGLHHFVYLPFFFTSLGGSAEIGGKVVEGAINIFQAQLSSPTAMFDINVTRFLMNGKILFASFGLPGAAFAMYHVARPENKKKVKALFIAAAIPAFFTGVTEPIEFSFMFIAPILYLVHAGMSGLAYFLTYLFNINVPGSSAFGGPFLSTIFNGMLQSSKGSNWIYIPIIGVIYFLAYYFIFKGLILKLNLKTPGRGIEDSLEEDEKNSTISKASDDIIKNIIEALGSKENILSVDACFTRLRVKVKDKSKVADDNKWKKLGANGVVRVQDGVQVIYGNKADVYKNKVREEIGMD